MAEIVECGDERENDRQLSAANPVFTPPRIKEGYEDWPHSSYSGSYRGKIVLLFYTYILILVS